ncbi:transcription regulatory SNF2 [Fusarium pseudocircinatum]|uniref:Transcription regulatory SNF2 n=1 Tax=Fusarium pseudocircinatum TaxID=56676 RepID=A0A8H5PEI3_9HYPO|nr:transcription regulatory SNF2 [Fusarium pseudocircinatum]
MDSDSIAHQSEAPLSLESVLSDATPIPIASPSSAGQKRSPSPTNDEPSKRAKTDEDSVESSDEGQQLDDENEEPGADIAGEAEEVPEVIEAPDNNTEDAPAIRLPYGFPPISPSKTQELKEWLARHANVKPDNQVVVGVHTQLLKPMEPEQQDMDETFDLMGIDTDGINWSEGIHIPGVMDYGLKARPHQLAGANWISSALESPLRAALLADECGTGKTVQIGLALALHYYRVKAEVQGGTFTPRDENRRFKPSIILCPADLAYQTFREWSRWIPNFFKIRICHRTKFLTRDHFTRMHIMPHKNGLQDWVNENTASHEDIETLRSIAIVPYYTAMRRMILRRRKDDDNAEDGEDDDNNGDDREENDDDSGDETGTPAQTGRAGKKRKTNAKEKIEFQVTGQSYNWVICDDVYPIRGPRPLTHKLIHQLEHEATLWPFVFADTEGGIDAEVYFDKDAWPTIRDGGEFGGLTIDHIVQPDHVVDPPTARNELIRDEYIRYIREKIGPLFLMNPDLFQKFREIKFERPEMAREAIRPLLEMFCLRRGMLTPAIMPDGTSVVPGEGIPEMRIRTVILQSYNDHDQQDLYQIAKHHYPDLTSASNEDDEHIGHGTIDKAKLTWVNPAVLRTLALSTTNVEFWPLTQKRGKDGKTTFLNSKPIQNLLNRPPHFERLQSFGLSGAAPPNAAPTAAADSENIEVALWKDGVGGLLWYFGQLQLAYGDDIEFPLVREDIPKTFCSRSPKLCWAINRVLELKALGKRVLIFVNHPLTSTILTALLTSLCVETLNIRSSHTVDQRAKMVREFTNTQNRAEALVMSYQLGGFGLNLHGACHHGIIVEYPDNLPTMLHAFGRLWRMGQEHGVHWDVLYLEESFDGWAESRMASKYADILAAEGDIPDLIVGEYRIICGFELIKRYLGQDSNRYPRTRVTWSEQDHPLVAREGHFYSAVARYLMQNPHHITKFQGRHLHLIARRWTPEHGDLTLNMIEGRSPILVNGVILDSRNPLTPGYLAVEQTGNLHRDLLQRDEIESNLEVDRNRLEMERKRRVGSLGYMNVSFTTPRGIDGKVPEEADARPEANESATQPISDGMMEISIGDTIEPQPESGTLEQVLSYWESPSNLITNSSIAQNMTPAYQADHPESSPLPRASIPFILDPDIPTPHTTGQDLTIQGRSQDPFELTEREAFLFMTYIHKLAPLSDACDDARHFALEVPRLALHQPMIMNGLLALASRYDSRCTNTPSDIESTFYHNKCIKLLIEAFAQPPETWDSTLLTAVVIARLYEENDNETDSYYHHLSGTQNLLNHEVIARFVMQGGLAEAASWVHLRQAIYVYVVRREPLEICLESFERSTVFRRSDDSAYANRAVYNFAKLMRLFLPMESPDGDLGKWEAVQREMQEWYDARPVSFKPIFHRAVDISSDRPFPVICFAASVPGESQFP